MGHSSALRQTIRGEATREVMLVLALVMLVKLAWLGLDHTLRLYMGDSMVYLQGAAWLSGAGGRSFLYGWTLHYLAYPFQSPLAIMLLQMVWSTLTALGLFLFLKHGLATRFWIACMAAVMLATEPAQLFLERMVMAETLGLLAFVTTFLLLSRYLNTGSLGCYLWACLGGLAAANFRMNFLPVVIGLGVLVPLAYVFLRPPGAPALSGRVKHLAVTFVFLVVCHVGYTQAYGHAVQQPAGYMALTGMMRIGLVAPLIRPEHFEGTGVPGAVLDEVKLPLKDHWQRGHHIWSPDGLWHTLEKHSSDPEMVARTITRRALLDDPIGLLKINVETMGGYFDAGRVHWRMLDDKGVIAPDENSAQWIQKWMGWDVRGINTLETPVRRLFASSTPWLTACLFFLPLMAVATLVIGWRRPNRLQYLLLFLASMGLFGSHLLFAHIVSFRYLHPFSWFMLANMACVMDTLAPRRYHAIGAKDRAMRDTPSS